jgi:hypothetical protein
MIGKLSPHTLALALKKGIDLSSGSLRKDGRVILQCWIFPARHKSGAALRSRIVWWLHNDESWLGDCFNVHHKNGVRSDDRIENLEKLDHAGHSSMHHPKYSETIRRCVHCHDDFRIDAWRLKDKTRGQFCSQVCYHNHPKKESTRKKQGASLKLAWAKGRRK